MKTTMLSAFLASLIVVSALPSPEPAATGLPTPIAALGELNGLKVAEEGSLEGYSHKLFLPRWRVVPGAGAGAAPCTTRQLVLVRDGQNVKESKLTCAITSGTWISPYEGGAPLTSATEVDIDHMVPLANAWATGASAWTQKEREDFANDLVHPELWAVSKKTNEAKGDKTPDKWMPPLKSFWCTYAESWVAVKSFYKLTVTAPEKKALQQMLNTCPM